MLRGPNRLVQRRRPRHACPSASAPGVAAQRGAHDLVGQPGRVALAGQQPDQPPRLHRRVKPASDRSRRSTSARAARARCRGRSGRRRLATASSSMPRWRSLSGDRPPASPRSRCWAQRIPVGQRRVVDQADLGEPVEHPVGRVAGTPRLRSAVGQFGAGARPPVEQSQSRSTRATASGSPGGRWSGRRRVPGVAASGRPCGCEAGHGPAPSSPSSEVDRGRHRRRSAQLSSTRAPMPSFSLIFFSISSARSGLSRRKSADVLLALAELVGLVGVPGAGLLDDALLDADVDQRALAADALRRTRCRTRPA